MDTMVDEMEILIDGFTGSANRTRCFAHIANLIAKAILRPFDVGKGNKGAEAFEDADATAAALRELADGLDVEEAITSAERASESVDEDVENEDNWLAELEELSSVEQDELRESSRPVKFVLVKVVLQYTSI